MSTVSDKIKRLESLLSEIREEQEAAKAITYHAEEAKKRQGTRTDLKENIVEPVPQGAGKARDQVGKGGGTRATTLEAGKARDQANSGGEITRPQSLDGLGYVGVLILEADGDLTREEKQWLNSKRNVPYGGMMPRLRID